MAGARRNRDQPDAGGSSLCFECIGAQRRFTHPMTPSPWSQTSPASTPDAAPRAASAVVVVIAVLLAAAVAGGTAWWLQSARVAAKEQERAAAAAELNALAARVQSAETTAADAAQRVKKAEADAQAAKAQASDGVTQLDAARRDAAAVRTERDEARASLTATRADLDRLKANDLDPGALPLMDLSKLVSGLRDMRVAADVQVAGPALASVDKDTVEKSLKTAMSAAGINPAAQSPFKLAVFVSVGKEQPRRALGVMVLLLRSMKVPGESGQREVAVWGQQRTSSCSDAEAAGQVDGLLEELAKEVANAAGIRSSAGATPPPLTPPTPPSTPPSPPPTTPPTAPPPAPPSNPNGTP